MKYQLKKNGIRKEFNRYLKKIRIGNKSEIQKKALVTINKLSNGRNNAIKFVHEYSSVILETKRKATKEEPKPEPTKTKTKRKKTPLELHEKFINVIKNDEKNINEQIFKEYFFYHTLLFLAKELYNSNQNVNDEMVKHSNDALIEFKKRY